MRLIPLSTAVLLVACSSDDSSSSGPPVTASDAGAADHAAPVDAHAAEDSAVEAAAPGDDDGGGSPSVDAAAPWKCPAGPFGNPIAGAAKPTLVAEVPPADGFVSGQAVLEGAVWIDDALYMSQFLNGKPTPPSRILKWTPGGNVSVFDADSGSNGLAVDQNGVLLAAMHSDGSISRLAGGKAQIIASAFNGKRFDSPNDLTVRADGTIYFTDPDWQAATARPQAKTRVYRIDPAGTVSVVDDSLNEPNGITLSPDASILYVSSLDGIFSFAVGPDGSTSGKKTFSSSSSDGMGIDCAGNLYATAGTDILVLAPNGSEVGRIPVDGVQALTNIAFGGVDRKTLFATSLGDTQTLHRVDLAVPGLPY